MKRLLSIFAFFIAIQGACAQSVYVMGIRVDQPFGNFANAVAPKLISTTRNDNYAIEGNCNFAGFNDCCFFAHTFSSGCGNYLAVVSIGIKTSTPEKTLQDIISSIQKKYSKSFQKRHLYDCTDGNLDKLGIIGHSNTCITGDQYVSQKIGSVTIICSANYYNGYSVWLYYYVDCRQSIDSSDL